MGRMAMMVLVLAGCNTPAPGFHGAEPVAVDVGGRSYLVYRRGDAVQAVRTSRDGAFQGGGAAMLAAMERGTGCRVAPASLRGDTVVAHGVAECIGPYVAPAKVEMELSCEVETGARFTYCTVFDG
ncbi:MAG: hypothetical protein ACU0CO_17045 [Shimia sp.]